MPVRKTAETRKTEITEAAIRLADTLGPDRLTTEAVGRAVGLTQPGVFRHFPRKQDMWEAVATRIGEKMEAVWKKARNAGDSAVDRLHAVVDAQLRLISTTPAIPAILFSRELHAENDALRVAFFGLMGRFHGLLAGLVAEARSAGELRADLDADDAALLILGLVQGLAVRWSVSGRTFDLPDEGRRLLELQLGGFLAGRETAGAEGAA